LIAKTIGTKNPQAKLEVAGAIRLTPTTNEKQVNEIPPSASLGDGNEFHQADVQKGSDANTP
jgi:hypothetical protein